MEGSLSSEPLIATRERDLEADTEVALYKAAVKGDKEEGKAIITRNPNVINSRVQLSTNDTALHIAAMNGHAGFVEMLLSLGADVKGINMIGKTPLCLAVEAGESKVVKKLSPHLLRDHFMHEANDGLPCLSRAIYLGNWEIVEHLYGASKHMLQENDLIDIFFVCIDIGYVDMCLMMMTNHPLIKWDSVRRTPKHDSVEAEKDSVESENDSVEDETLTETVFHMMAHKRALFDDVDGYMQGLALETLRKLLDQLAKRDWHNITDIIRRPSNLIFDATKAGNYHFLVATIEKIPNLIWEQENEGSLFRFAIQARNLEIFNLIHRTKFGVRSILLDVDKEGNNFLHIAAKLPDKGILSKTIGADYQLQDEMTWFQELGNLVTPTQMKRVNIHQKTPVDVFAEEHRELMLMATTCIKEKATYCLSISVALVSLVFAGSFRFKRGILTALSESTIFLFSLLSLINMVTILAPPYCKLDVKRAFPLRFTIGLVSLLFTTLLMSLHFCGIFLISLDGYRSSNDTNGDILLEIAFNFGGLISMIYVFVFVVYPLLRDVLFRSATGVRVRRIR